MLRSRVIPMLAAALLIAAAPPLATRAARLAVEFHRFDCAPCRSCAGNAQFVRLAAALRAGCSGG